MAYQLPLDAVLQFAAEFRIVRDSRHADFVVSGDRTHHAAATITIVSVTLMARLSCADYDPYKGVEIV